MAGTSLCFINSVKILAGAEIWMLDAATGLRDRGLITQFITAPDSPLSSAAKSAGFPCTDIPIRFDTAPWTILKILRALQSTSPATVICNQLKDLKAGGVAARLAGIPRIYLTRESDFPFRRRLHYRFYLQQIATGVLVNSISTLETTRQSAPWLRPEKLHLLYKGIDIKRYYPADKRPEGFVVGFAGQLIQRKGLQTLMQAWHKIENSGLTTPPRLLLAGEGPLLSELKIWRASLKNPDAIEILGQRDQMPSFYHDIHMLVLPSEQEGFGLVAAEASASGLPVVASNISSLPELIRHNETGLLIPPQDPEALATAIMDLAVDPDRCRQLGVAGQSFIRNTFSRTAMLDGLIDLILPEQRDQS